VRKLFFAPRGIEKIRGLYFFLPFSFLFFPWIMKGMAGLDITPVTLQTYLAPSFRFESLSSPPPPTGVNYPRFFEKNWSSLSVPPDDAAISFSYTPVFSPPSDFGWIPIIAKLRTPHPHPVPLFLLPSKPFSYPSLGLFRTLSLSLVCLSLLSLFGGKPNPATPLVFFLILESHPTAGVTVPKSAVLRSPPLPGCFPPKVS